jgi:DNA-binding CsgD family transcriptional regulator
MSCGRAPRHQSRERLARSEIDTTRRPKAALDDAERELAVLLAVLTSLTEWDSFEHGSERLLAELAGALGQMAGALWLPHEEMMVTRAIWSMPIIDREAFAHALDGLRVPRGVGLAGCAWEQREAVDRPTFGTRGWPTRRADPPHGLRPSIALPCFKDDEVLGVVELYSTAQAELSVHLMHVLAHAGHALGAFFARRRGELSLSPLSPRETQVLALAGQGLPVRRIAEHLTISPATVKTHLEHIYRKLGVRDRTAAVANALRGGLIE